MNLQGYLHKEKNVIDFVRGKDLEATALCGNNKWRVLVSDWFSGHAEVKQWGELFHPSPGVHRSVISRNPGRVKAAFIPDINTLQTRETVHFI